MAITQNFWLVKTGTGASEVQNLPAGQKPLQANWHAAVYLGSTVDSAAKRIAAAARQLGVPNPQNVPSLGTSVGIIGAEVTGFGAGAIAAAGAASEGAAAAETGAGAGAAGEGAAAGTAAGTASKVLSTAKTVAGGLTVASLFTNTNLWAGLGMTLLGAFLVLFGIVKLSGADVTSVAKRIVP